MLFQLNEFHRNTPESELSADLQRVAQFYGCNTLTAKQYAEYGRFSIGTFRSRFNSWNNALQMAGLVIKKIPTQQQLIEDIRNTANRLGKSTITSTEYELHGMFTRQQVKRACKSWSNAMCDANLQPTGFNTAGISENLLLEEIANVWLKIGKQPTTADFRKNKLFKYGLTTYTRRFGSWRNALTKLMKVMHENGELQLPSQQQQFDEQTIESNPQPYKHKTTRDVNYRLRYQVMMRDQCRCRCCGKSPATDPGVELEIDHIIPWSKGGETTLDNLQTLCKQCNRGKSNS